MTACQIRHRQNQDSDQHRSISSLRFSFFLRGEKRHQSQRPKQHTCWIPRHIGVRVIREYTTRQKASRLRVVILPIANVDQSCGGVYQCADVTGVEIANAVRFDRFAPGIVSHRQRDFAPRVRQLARDVEAVGQQSVPNIYLFVLEARL